MGFSNHTLGWTDPLPYPTPHLEGLFARLRREIDRIGQLLGERAVVITVPMNGITHTRMLSAAHEMFVRADPALAFFLAYPTRRLSSALIKAAADAATAIAWLAQNPPSDSEMPHLDQEYGACCERIQSGIRDWRLSVDLKRAECDLDQGPAETIN